MIVAGVMSGTSADGIDVALVRIHGRPPALRFRLLHHRSVAYPPALRKEVLAAMAAPKASVPNLARLNARLSEAYAQAILACCKAAAIERPDLIGCHGQTIYHQGLPSQYIGQRITTTWQLGDGSLIAARTATPVVCDFRQADMAAGGKGAPLVPFFDFLAFTHRRRLRIALNLGGIANITILPPRAEAHEVVAFAPPELGSDQYCVEELENHLHPRLISILIELFRQASHEFDLQGVPRGQVLMTTHSPFVMDKFSLNEIIVLSRKDAESKIVYPGTSDALRELVESNELGIGDLFYSGALADA